MLRPIPREAPVRIITFEEDMLVKRIVQEVCERVGDGGWEGPKREP